MDQFEDKITYDDTTGLPVLSSVYTRIKEELARRKQAGFLYFDIVDFRSLEEKYGYIKCQNLLELVGKTLRKQRRKLYRDEDLMVVGGKGLDYFVLFLFSTPRRKENFSNHDMKIITTRIKQKLINIIDEHSDELGIDEEIDFHTGYTVLKEDPFMEVERLIYEARKEAGFKAQLEEIMVQFIANVSHELRTPLTSIKGYTETLLEGAMNDANLCERWLEVIYSESQRLERLINDLLDLSMLEAEQVELNLKELDIREVVKNVISILHPQASRDKVKITASFPDNLPKLTFDEDRIKQVLLNLIHNAVKYSPENGEVKVQGEELEREVRISISDEGAGIPQKHLDKIFERFYRVEKNMAKTAGGRGLGLAIARHIVETHGGNIGATSKVGNGSSFYFTLPIEPIFPADEEVI